jgi:3-phenylpropionate/cinnamic acid dioxygenase small subunit
MKVDAQRQLSDSVKAFLLEEADLLDQCLYSDWELLWAEQGEYWIPAGREDYDPRWNLSIVYDDRAELHNRVKRLLSGAAYTQEPRSQLRRTVSNVQLMKSNRGFVDTTANFVLLEFRRQRWTTWAGRTEHRLQRTPAGFRIERKTVRLVGSDGPLPMLQFLL